MARKFNVRVNAGQSIYDLALQYYGDINQAFKIVEENDNVESVEASIVGKTIMIERSNDKVVKFFRSLDRNVSTK